MFFFFFLSSTSFPTVPTHKPVKWWWTQWLYKFNRMGATHHPYPQDRSPMIIVAKQILLSTIYHRLWLRKKSGHCFQVLGKWRAVNWFEINPLVSVSYQFNRLFFPFFCSVIVGAVMIYRYIAIQFNYILLGFFLPFGSLYGADIS